MQRKIYETPGEKRKDFWIGFIGWFVMNAALGGLSVLFSGLLSSILANTNDFETISAITNYLGIFLSCLPLLINVGVMTYFAYTRDQIAMGMLVAFGTVFLLVICLGIIATVACFVLLGQNSF